MNDLTIKIEYSALPNKRAGHGFVPVIWVDGQLQASTYLARGYDLEDAWKVAQAMATDEAGHYLGDYEIEIVAR